MHGVLIHTQKRSNQHKLEENKRVKCSYTHTHKKQCQQQRHTNEAKDTFKPGKEREAESKRK